MIDKAQQGGGDRRGSNQREQNVPIDLPGTDTGEAWLTEFSTANLKQLFALPKEAVAR